MKGLLTMTVEINQAKQLEMFNQSSHQIIDFDNCTKIYKRQLEILDF